MVARWGECHIDSRWRLLRRAAFNGSMGLLKFGMYLLGCLLSYKYFAFPFMGIDGVLV